MQRLVPVMLLGVLASLPGLEVRAGVVVHLGADPGAGPGQSAPNSATAAAAFAAEVGGTTSLIDFESAPIGNFSTLNLASGVTATLSGTDTASPPGFTYGVTTDHPDVRLGYGTTPGGSRFVRVTPTLGAASASLAFHFTTPVDAIGLTITGLGTASGPLYAVFGTGAGEEHAINGSDAGGRLFFGLTGLTAGLTDFTLELRGVGDTSRDVFGVDDVQYHPQVIATAVPEPGTWLPALIGVAALASITVRRRG